VRTWLAALAALSLPLTLSSPATAHDAAVFYPDRWPTNRTVHYSIHEDVPLSGGFRNSLASGLARWSDLAGGNGPEFIRDAVSGGINNFYACDNAYGGRLFVAENLASYLGYPSESVLGFTQPCIIDGVWTKFQITFEKTAEASGASGWNTDDTAPGPNQWDLQSIATHEAGHATGFVGHFSAAAYCPSPADATTQTMCAGDPSQKGTSMVRSLEDHDLHTLDNAY